jgi:DNA-binding Lrp family transcriptional regulator
MDKTDTELLDLLREDGRASTAELARRLGLSRTTVKSRIERLEKRGIISGFTVRLSPDYQDRQIEAHVMISSDPKQTAHIVRRLRNMPEVTALHAVNGVYDLIAIVRTASTRALDLALDQIGNIEGISRTTSSILLSTKFER